MKKTRAPCADFAASYEFDNVNAPSASAATFYDRVWSDWGHLDERSPAAFHRRRLLICLIREYARSSRRILEVGCGQGNLLRELAREFPAALVYGADVADESLTRAQSHCPRASLFRLDLDSPFFDEHAADRLGQFDLVICSEVLEHLHEDRRALIRLAGLLAPNGKVIVSVPGGNPTRFDRAIGHLRHYTEAQLEARLCDAGFHVERIFAWGFPFHTFYRWVVKWAARVALHNRDDSRPVTNSAPSPLISYGYAAFALALKPLYYLNRERCGPQLFAVAQKQGATHG
ncbi:MAG: class I SAM-dependent methyltransferase [Myxococcota bacterium]